MKNKYEICGDEVIIHMGCSDGAEYECYIDLEDLPILMEKNWTWRAVYSGGSRRPYAMSNNTSMHRLLTNAKKGDIVDHRDRDGLNNRRKTNLRTVTHTTSVQNRNTFKNSVSGHAGVNWSSQYNKWKAKIRINGKEIYLGRYETMEEAIEARKAGEEKYWGYRT